MSRFSVGDRVTVVDKGAFPAHCFDVGDVLQVLEPHNDGVCWRVQRLFDGCKQWVTGSELKLETPRTKIVVTTDGKTTTARLFSGKELVKSATAKCSKSDTFDFETGAALALDRLLDREAKAEPAVPEFNRSDLVLGRFGRTSSGKWFVVLPNTLVYEAGGFDFYPNTEGGWINSAVDCVIEACSFNNARSRAKQGRFVWVRPGAKFD